jgi:hypothetical protein
MALSRGSRGWTDRLGRLFYPVGIVAVLAALIGVQYQLGPQFAAFGLYALAGLVGGAAVYYGTTDAARGVAYRIDERVQRTGVYVTCALTVGSVALTNEPLVVVVGLVVGYTLVVRQLFADVVPERIVPQITALFLLSPVTKYLTSGQYIGHGDLLVHTRLAEDIMSAGSLEAIAAESYFAFPGLQLIAGTVGSITGLGPYDGLLLAGLAGYAVLLPAVFLVVSRFTGSATLALYTALAVACLDGISFFASYVFPQSIATIMVAVLAVLASLVSRDAIKWEVTGAFVVVAVALSVTHHLTQVLFVPVVGVALLVYVTRGRAAPGEVLTNRVLALLSIVAVVTAVRLVRTGFLDRLVRNGLSLVQGGPLAGYTRSVSLGFGRPPRTGTVSAALEWLISPYGIYLVLLLLVFSVGVVGFLRMTDRPTTYATLFWAGVVGSVLIFETPVSVKSLIRIRSPWLFVFAFVIGMGLLQLKRRTGTRRSAMAMMAVIVALAATAPVVTADDYYDLDPRPNVQTSFSDQEVEELRAVSGYSGGLARPPVAFTLTQQTMERHGVGDARTARLEGRQLVLPEGHFIYRSRWPGHKVHFTVSEGDRLYSNSLYVAGSWLGQRVAGGNKVYDVGGTGVMWRTTARPFGGT